ncbi:MAG: serine/threonine-protein kinase [Desulfobacterales bacterium]
MMRLKKFHSASLIIILLTTLVILGKIFVDTDPLPSQEYKIYDWMSRLRKRPTASPVVILAIDDKSIRSIGSWPWPRSYIAGMIERLSDYGAHTMGISLLYSSKEVNPGLVEIQDIKERWSEIPSKAKKPSVAIIETVLTEAEKKLDHDTQLISAVRSAHNVILPLRFALRSADQSPPASLSKWLQMNSVNPKNVPDAPRGPVNGFGQIGEVLRQRRIVAGQLCEPYDELSRKAGAVGHMNLLSEADGIVRRIPLLIRYQDRKFPAFALQVARKYRGIPLRDLKATDAGLDLKKLQIPTDKNYHMFIDFSGPNANLQRFSFIDVINEKIPAEFFRHKVVLLGLTAEEWSPHFKTPFTSAASALDIEASAVENIINGAYISRPDWVFFLEIAALLYFGVFLWLVIPRVSPRIGALILGLFLLTWIATSGFLFFTKGIWLKILAPMALAMIGFTLTSLTRRRYEKQSEHAELNKSLGLALQGQGMLDMAFEKFVKCPIEDKSVRELLYNLGLDFERKRMFNKALAVYHHILKGGALKDIKERIEKLLTLEKALVMPAADSAKKTAIFLENGTTHPTLGRYEILKVLGQGAMGTVYLGRDPSINRDVAVKTISYDEINPNDLADVKSRFFREAEAAGKLSHPNIVTIYDVGEDHDIAYIAMELLNGKDLTHYCRNGDMLPVKRVLDIAAEVAQALGYAHKRQVVHRDIKPANIILQGNSQIKVADFGIARVISSSKTQTGVIFGTPSYMSPEQIAGKEVDGRSDLFSLGIVLYELLTGKRPFTGETIEALLRAVSSADYPPLKDLAPKIPPCCCELIDKLLAKGVSKRPRSASQVVNDIRACREMLN